MTKFFVLGLLILSIVMGHNHPMVGVITYPGSPGEVDSTSYIQAETVKFVESTGARNVAIKYDQNWITSSEELDNLNGIILQNSFNGAYNKDETYENVLLNAYLYAEAKADDQDIFPLMASGVAALQLSEILSSSQDLSQYTIEIDALDLVTDLEFTKDASLYQNKMAPVTLTMASISEKFIRSASNEGVAYFNQDKGITIESFKNDEFISNSFEIVATAKDRQGTEFIALLVGKEVPVILSFVLPESIYNFYPETNVPHSTEATKFSIDFSKIFTDLTKKNEQTYGSTETEYSKNLYNLELTTTVGPEFQTFYF